MKRPLGSQLADVLVRLYLARKARREARKAFADYLARAWGETEPDEDGPGHRSPAAHPFGACGLGYTGNPRDPYDAGERILCPVCAGSAPYHAAYLRATREAGNALRQAQAIGRRFAEDRAAALERPAEAP